MVQKDVKGVVLVPTLRQEVQAKRKRNAEIVNAGLTAGAIATAGAAAVGADKLVKMAQAEVPEGEKPNIVKRAADKLRPIWESIKDALKPTPAEGAPAPAAAEAAAKETAEAAAKPTGAAAEKTAEKAVQPGWARRQLNKVVNAAKKVGEFVGKINSKVKLAAGTVIAGITAFGIYNAGKIHGQDAGVKEFSNDANKIANAFTKSIEAVQSLFTNDQK